MFNHQIFINLQQMNLSFGASTRNEEAILNPALGESSDRAYMSLHDAAIAHCEPIDFANHDGGVL